MLFSHNQDPNKFLLNIFVYYLERIPLPNMLRNENMLLIFHVSYLISDIVLGRKLGTYEECRKIQTTSWLPLCHVCLLVDKAINQEGHIRTL